MPKLILKSPCIKCGGAGGGGGYLRYIGTRDGVEPVSDDRPATKRQEQLIRSLVRDFPDTKELLECDDWQTYRTKAHASAFISAALECNWERANRSDVYLKYIATRPRVERLGYDHASAWRDLLRQERNEIAVAMSIPSDHFRWYAAFHDEGDHPHVHMMAWSSQPKEGWLDRDGIRKIKSTLTNQIFQQEMLHLYEQKTVSRDELVREARASMLALAKEMRQGICDHPEAEKLMWELAQVLDGVKGQKKYGYLPKRVKKLVDEVVDEMERLPAVAKCYEQWQMLQGEVHRPRNKSCLSKRNFDRSRMPWCRRRRTSVCPR